MHYELHVWFPFRFSLDNEHHPIAPFGNQVLDTQISHSYTIGDGIFTEPHTVALDIPRCLVGHCHCAVISLRSHVHF